MEKWQMEACIRAVYSELMALKDGTEEYQKKHLLTWIRFVLVRLLVCSEVLLVH